MVIRVGGFVRKSLAFSGAGSFPGPLGERMAWSMAAFLWYSKD
jgi:hypothetical protein